MWRPKGRIRPTEPIRVRAVAVFFLLLATIILFRLFSLQVLQHRYYALFASSAHEISRELLPQRGAIYFSDTRSGELLPAAINRRYFILYAVPREILPADVASIAAKLATHLGLTADTARSEFKLKLSSSERPYYQPLARKLDDLTKQKIAAERLPGIYFTPEEYRFYPEQNSAAALVGFSSRSDNGLLEGRYGLEGYWQKELAGTGGIISGSRGALGSWIAPAERKIVSAVPGADLVTTIDRTLQFKACERLAEGLAEYGARSAALVLMRPSGAILAICSSPDFNPNEYSQVGSLAVYNNTAIFTPYEPGSVFKPINMAAALDQNAVQPDTVFTDPCRRVIGGFTINNAENKCYQQKTMTQVLEYSINTGMVWMVERLGRKAQRDYIKRFGFGEITGLAIDTEAAGNISSLDQPGPIYPAVASFGQGLTVTPLQLAVAYSAIAADGRRPKPYIVSEVRFADGRVERFLPAVASQSIAPRSAKLLTGMLVSVASKYRILNGLGPYYVAGKTGTAQIPGKGGYTSETNHTFAGFAPADDPSLVLVVKYEAPQRSWAEASAGPVWRDIMKFALEYYGIAGTKK